MAERSDTIGFIGLGVMGEPMCRNLADRSGRRVLASDLNQAPLQRLAAHGVQPADLKATAAGADTIFLSLPGGREVEAVCETLLPLLGSGQTVVDCSTSPVGLTRALAARFAAQGVDYADAPVARTREAAEKGTLAIMVGASAPVFDRIRPLLACCASDISHCGEVGAGQMAKILNNMVLFQTVVALSEALALAESAGVDGRTMFDTLTTGSADSFALRNHGMKAVLPGVFPERAFSARYALKDLTYALDLAREGGVDLPGAETARRYLEAAIAAGDGDLYWPAIARRVAKRKDGEASQQGG
ncbi:MAG: NAD(P)-dependent oxidoreductase [Reyranellaceae bacterium]